MSTEQPGEGHTVLIIEDDIAIREMYRTKFNLSGYHTVIAKDGIAGVEMAEKYSPELIMIDIMMPKMDGYETLKRIRQTEKGYDVPVIILTSLNKDEAPSNISKLNPHSYIVKTDKSPSEIEQYVREILKA